METNMSENSELIQATIAKLIAETGKLNAENAKLSREARWYPAIVATAFVTAVIALAKYLAGA